MLVDDESTSIWNNTTKHVLLLKIKATKLKVILFLCPRKKN